MTSIIDILKKSEDITLDQKDFKTFFDKSEEAFIIAAVSGKFLYVNKSFCKILGYKKNELETQNFYKFIHPDDIDNTIGAQDTLHKNKIILNFENRYKTKQNEYIWLCWNAIQQNNKLYCCAKLRNINDNYISKLAHSLKNPLQIIIGCAELLKYNSESEVEEEDSTELLQEIIGASENINNNINNILKISKITLKNINF